MHLCINSLTALALVRRLRAEDMGMPSETCGVPSPDPWPNRRWTPRLIPHQLIGLSDPPSERHPIHVVSPDASSRPKAAFMTTTVYGRGIPPGSFARVSENFTVPRPELLFLELANVMDRPALELLGYELCGTFSRCADNPRTGKAVHGVAPLTSVAKIRDYVCSCLRVRGRERALAALENVRDNAWSAMEAIVALALVRPLEKDGYGIRNIKLNAREQVGRELRPRVSHESRVPDISLGDLPVGFNYDGYGHLDLNSIDVKALDEDELKASLARVREKYVDDLRRNRELLASGRIVLPVVAEDLMDSGGLDSVVLEAVIAAERLTGESGETGAIVRQALERPHAARRQRIIWSLYPWRGGVSLGNY